MKRLVVTTILLINITGLLLSQNASRFSAVIEKHLPQRINIVLQNISADTAVIEQFNCTYSKGYFIPRNYLLSNDTVVLNWQIDTVLISSGHPISYSVDGVRRNTNYRIAPKEKLRIAISVSKSDCRKIKFVAIQLNQKDRINIKL